MIQRLKQIRRRHLGQYRKRDLFKVCLIMSIAVHGMVYGIYYVKTHLQKPPSSDYGMSDVEVDFEDIPPEPAGSKSSAAEVEKQEWVEGTSKTAADAEEKERPDELSGDGTDSDGYLYSYNGDRPPKPIIDFNLRQYYPHEARQANITGKTIIVEIQVDEKGLLMGARLSGEKIGYGFEDAAMKVIRRMRFQPGYADGIPVKMTHKLPITFKLEE